MTTSYWLDEPAPPIPQRRLDGLPDAVVVGGGVTGCAAALRLAEAGLKVRLHDAREIAGGASGRNGGFALRGGAAPYDVTVETVGRDATVWLWRRTEQALDRLEALAGDALIRTGSLRLAADEEERDALAVELEGLRADGFAAEWVEEPLDGRFRAAIFHPPDAALQPARLVRRLAVRAAEAGVEIREHSRVESLDGLEAEHVLVATDGYPSGLLGELEGLIVPTRGQMIATEPLTERIFECPHYGRHGFDYWQQTPDGRILAGGFRDSALQDEFTTDEVTTSGHPERARRLRCRPGRPSAADRLSLGRAVRARPRFPAGRRARPRRRPCVGRGRLLGPRQRARLPLRRARRRGDARAPGCPSSPCSILPGCSSPR